MLHVSRPIRWDSDHVTIMDDPTQELFFEIVRADALDRVHYGLDFFDGSINRIGAYVIGSRSAQKCMLRALLEPKEAISKLELAGEGSKSRRLCLGRLFTMNSVFATTCQLVPTSSLKSTSTLPT